MPIASVEEDLPDGKARGMVGAVTDRQKRGFKVGEVARRHESAAYHGWWQPTVRPMSTTGDGCWRWTTGAVLRDGCWMWSACAVAVFFLLRLPLLWRWLLPFTEPTKKFLMSPVN
jgi:hypothetical protein